MSKGVIIGALALAGVAIVLLASRTHAQGTYTCPYCGLTFATYDELVAHVQSTHAGQRIPIDVNWG